MDQSNSPSSGDGSDLPIFNFSRFEDSELYLRNRDVLRHYSQPFVVCTICNMYSGPADVIEQHMASHGAPRIALPDYSSVWAEMRERMSLEEGARSGPETRRAEAWLSRLSEILLNDPSGLRAKFPDIEISVELGNKPLEVEEFDALLKGSELKSGNSRTSGNTLLDGESSKYPYVVKCPKCRKSFLSEENFAHHRLQKGH
ncbi:uncharacterized protein LOC100906878 [Galendromus occidentalis]|uniref:Uncharacterized protein LOC100906878 n=1 Tax=Galendromus occidentalis TaxID=34638 RepID=A0AAJ6QRE2_9ACAR|nr:uncharacterized protein LOC100906878 [Galendromus occidentalis]